MENADEHLEDKEIDIDLPVLDTDGVFNSKIILSEPYFDIRNQSCQCSNIKINRAVYSVNLDYMFICHQTWSKNHFRHLIRTNKRQIN